MKPTTLEQKIFSHCVRFGYVHRDYQNASIYRVDDHTGDEIRYRVDLRELGSFEIAKKDGDEEYRPKIDEWVFVSGVIYSFLCITANASGNPLITPSEAYAALKCKGKPLTKQ